MSRNKVEKFEMKYGYFLPEDFKDFIEKFGGNCTFGSCSFDYREDVTNNFIRSSGKMDFHLVPFGMVGNGDYYCFYRFSEKKEDYFIGIWLSETRNFVILCKTFKSFIYRCALDDFFATIISHDNLSFKESVKISEESLKKCYEICGIYGFDIEKIKRIKSQLDYHKLMVEFDESAIQSLCYLGKYYLNINREKAFGYFKRVKSICPTYTAPYYILGKYYMGKGMRECREEFKKGLKSSLIFTGFSYWEEDFIDIPEDVHRSMLSWLNMLNKDENIIFIDKDPYNTILRLEIAQKFRKQSKYKEALTEYANAIYCCEDNTLCKDILREALVCSKESGELYLVKLIEYDIKLLK